VMVRAKPPRLGNRVPGDSTDRCRGSRVCALIDAVHSHDFNGAVVIRLFVLH